MIYASTLNEIVSTLEDDCVSSALFSGEDMLIEAF